MIASRRHMGGLLGISSEALRGWVEREEVNAGERPGVPDSESEIVWTYLNNARNFVFECNIRLSALMGSLGIG